MIKPRVIPCLLLKNRGLVKGVKFKDHTYVGDPINTVKILNEKEVDELAILDITATLDRRQPSYKFIEDIASECFMPIAYGGGIKTVEDAKEILKLGIEKIIINTAASEDPSVVKRISHEIGSQSLVVSIDAKRKWAGGYEVFSHSGTKPTGLCPIKYALKAQEMGAGEILLTSIDQEGTLQGYDLKLLKSVSEAVNIPVISSGGAYSLEHLREGLVCGGASAVAGGSFFVFQGKYKAVLISYPSYDQILNLK